MIPKIEFPKIEPGELTVSDKRQINIYQQKNDLKADGVPGHETIGTLFFERTQLRIMLQDALEATESARQTRNAAIGGVLIAIAFALVALYGGA